MEKSKEKKKKGYFFQMYNIQLEEEDERLVQKEEENQGEEEKAEEVKVEENNERVVIPQEDKPRPKGLLKLADDKARQLIDQYKLLHRTFTESFFQKETSEDKELMEKINILSLLDLDYRKYFVLSERLVQLYRSHMLDLSTLGDFFYEVQNSEKTLFKKLYSQK